MIFKKIRFILYFQVIFFLGLPADEVQSKDNEFITSLHSEEVGHFKIFQENNSQFAFEFYKILSKQSGNFSFSPYSISSGLAALALGAKGVTTTQIQKALGYSSSLVPLFGNLNEFLINHSDSKQFTRLYLANGLWLKKDLVIAIPFKQAISRDFPGMLQSIDFTTSLNQVIQTINFWTSQQTKGKINNFLEVRGLTSGMHMLLTTAATLEGAWAHPFELRHSKREQFHTVGNRNFFVEMMHATIYIEIWKNDKWDLIVLPLVKSAKGAQFEMMFILPKTNSLEELEQEFGLEKWREWVSNVKMEVVKISLPRFRIEKKFDLKTYFNLINLSLLFSPEANFSGITASHKEFYLQQALHKSALRISERGVNIGGLSGTLKNEVNEDKKPYEVNINHPFIFLIWDKVTETIIEMGRMTTPS